MSTKKPHNVTIKDLARILGFSPSTISRALKDHPSIGEKTKLEVKQLAEEMKYEPNPMALSFRNSKTNSIGVIVPEIVHHYFSTVISGIEEVAHALGYQVLISQSNESEEREKDNCRTLFDSRVDGFLICVSKNTFDFEHILALMDKGFPVVMFDRAVSNLDCSNVHVNDVKGGEIATQHLIDVGCKRIAHIAGPKNLSNLNERKEGFIKAMKENDIPVIDELVIHMDYIFGNQDRFKVMEELLQKQPDGIFIHNDMLAVELLEIAKKKNIKIPEDLKVVGYSNWFFTSHTSPSLSTIDQQGTEIGKKAAELLLDEIKINAEESGFIEPQNIILEPGLVVRGSSVKQ